MKGATFSMVENTCGGPAMVAFDHLELLIMSSGINRLRAATAKNAGALNYMPPDFPFRACPLLETICLFTPFPRKRWGIRATRDI
jgi:hypothetical protein